MEVYFERAIANVVRHGDTDIFPFPIENHVFFDCKDKAVALLKDMHGSFAHWMANYPPAHETAISPVGYTGFRWATQLDPLWNLYFLALVLSIADAIEARRIPSSETNVFSYRYKWDQENCTMYDPTSNWRTFMEASLRRAESSKYVIACDISEFYSRLGHHRLDNALAHLELQNDVPWRIKEFLSNYSNTNSFGLPVGGPAARLLSELVLDQVDQLLKLESIPFCRFSDDFHLFAESTEDAFAKLLFLTDKLQRTQGLQLQKAKTRIMSSAEFVATSPIRLDDHDAPAVDPTKIGLQEKARSLLRFSLRFDPYSPTAEEDYERLKTEIEKHDIIGLLQSELSKSRIHVALARKIVATIRYLSPQQRDEATLSIIHNSDLLFPIFASVMNVIKQLFLELSNATQEIVIERILFLIQSGSHIFRVELNLAYAIRVLAYMPSPKVQETLARLYNSPSYTPLIRRDIILAMARWRAWPWLSDRRPSFRSMSQAERRAFIIASFKLKDEGKHWRSHLKGEFSPFEKLIQDWTASKSGQPDWNVPL
ncbi:RNA-directed DNA polymerase [Methylosinus sporium]|uniref:RNA-directed DNA polymerase n=1 Tax=Methylosinus sporium TaxID=428 RepID=A0A549STT1_METSR|nr:RNA-directed DNA polymerase [Methylosinus sporium]TRL33056.1 RNA-directed DNA polymerase [Methylosinus sporium]